MEIPQIDISPLINNGTCEDLHHVVAQIKMACESLSCFYVTGHGIDGSLMEKLMECGKDFFKLSTERKTKINLRKSSAYRGYVQQGSEKTSDKVDMKEGIYFGPESCDVPDAVAGDPMMGANQFPDEKELPGFAATTNAYMDKMSAIGHAIMKGLALSLELNDDFFVDKFTPPFPLLAFWHYPPVPADSDSWGVGPHTDYGVLTLLMQDDVGGLQIETKSGDWIDVPPIPGEAPVIRFGGSKVQVTFDRSQVPVTALLIGTFVVNIGDVVEAWTRGQFRATMHRVKNSASRHRISAPFFFQPGLDCSIKPLDDVISTENGDETSSTRLVLNKPFIFGEYILNKFEKSYGNN